MNKILVTIVLSLLFSGNVFAEKFPEELKHKELGIGMKKLSKNFLCKNITDNKDRIKFSYQEFVSDDKKILFSLGYDDEFKLFYLPISILTKYKNLKGDKSRIDGKNEFFVGYRLMGDFTGENWFERFIFINPKSTSLPYYFYTEVYTLSDSEQNTFDELMSKTWLESNDITEELWTSNSYQEKFLKDLTAENNKLHELISKDFKSYKNPTIKNLTEPEDTNRLDELGLMARKVGAPRTLYQCGKK